MTWKCPHCNSWNLDYTIGEGECEQENNNCTKCGESRLK